MLILPAFTTLESWAKEKNIPFSGRPDLIKNPEVNRLYEQEIEAQFKDFGRVEQIRKFVLLETEWSQDTGEMTPTMKLKRKVIREKYEKRNYYFTLQRSRQNRSALGTGL